jgi:hypothetical protein
LLTTITAVMGILRRQRGGAYRHQTSSNAPGDIPSPRRISSVSLRLTGQVRGVE